MNNAQYDISIIVPVYNVENYINECIDSILNQTFGKFELILVDDGSKDSSGIICDEYSKKDKRIRVIHKINGGLSSARNVGIDNSSGKYITFIDSDDYISENYIKILYTSIKYNQADIAMVGLKKFKLNDKKIEYKLNREISILNSEQCLQNLYCGEWTNFVTACGSLYKKDLFNNIRFPEGKLNEDLFIIHRLYLESKKVVYNDSKLYFYRYREDSIMNKKFTYKNFDDLEAFEQHINFYIENKYYNLEKRAIKRYCYHLKCFYSKFKKDTRDLRGLNIIRKKHKKIKEYVKNKNYYTVEERQFINAPWCCELLIEPYWFLIAIKNKINRKMKG